MSRKLKRGITSLPFAMEKLYRRISTARPSTLILSALTIGIVVFFFGGGLYDVIMKPFPAVYYGGRFVFVYPQLSEQFIADSLVAMILYALGIGGLVVIYQSTKHAYKPRQAYMMLILGAFLLLVAYVFLEAAIEVKLGG